MNQLTIRNIGDARTLIENQKESFTAMASAHQEVNFAKESGFAMQCLENNDFLFKTAMKSPLSLKNAITNVAAIGLSLSPAEKLAYLVPLDNKVNLFVSYMGMVYLATKSGSVLWVQSHIVRKNDIFKAGMAGDRPFHDFDHFGKSRGEIIGAYCIAKLPCRDFLTEIMSIEEIDKIKASSKTADKSFSPWKSFPEEMIKKTVTKRAAKMWPAASNNRLAQAIHMSNDTEGIDFEDSKEPRTVENVVDKIDYKAEAALKEELIANITKECSGITIDMSPDEKMTFSVETLELDGPYMESMKRKSVNDLQRILAKL